MLEMTTINAFGTGWVDNIPGGVSTGYQAQNTAAEAVRNGIDTITIRFGGSLVGLYAEAGGTIDENGILYTLKDNQTIDTTVALPFKNIPYYFALKVVSPTERSIELITELTVGGFYPEQNGYYTTDGRRILNSYVERVSTNGDFAIMSLPIGTASPTKYPLANHPKELIDYASFSNLKMSCAGSQVYDLSAAFGAEIPTLSGISYSTSQGVAAKVWVGKSDGVYEIDVANSTVTGHSLSNGNAPQKISGVRGIAYIPDEGLGYSRLAVSCQNNRIYIYKNLDGLPHNIIDCSSFNTLYDIDWKDGKLYSCDGSRIHEHLGLTATINQSWNASTNYFATIKSGANEFVYSFVDGTVQTPFHDAKYFYGRSYGNSIVQMTYFRFGGKPCKVIAEGDGVLMSFDFSSKKLYVQ